MGRPPALCVVLCRREIMKTEIQEVSLSWDLAGPRKDVQHQGWDRPYNDHRQAGRRPRTTSKRDSRKVCLQGHFYSRFSKKCLMVSTTRSRICPFVNKFRKPGYSHYGVSPDTEKPNAHRFLDSTTCR